MDDNSKAAYSKLEITPSKTTRYEAPIDFENASLNTERKKFDHFETPIGSRRSDKTRLHGRFAREESDTDFQSGVKSQRQMNHQREASLRRLMAMSRQAETPQDQITHGRERLYEKERLYYESAAKYRYSNHGSSAMKTSARTASQKPKAPMIVKKKTMTINQFFNDMGSNCSDSSDGQPSSDLAEMTAKLPLRRIDMHPHE